MNCQEVMELMQRQLDQDLDAQEEVLLASHLEHCLDCAKMFERLQLLSNELTNLPKVIPSYSLVDAILPMLNEIDSQLADSGHDIYSSTSIPAAQQPRSIPWTRRFGSQISWKVAGGVIAAGLVIGFFIFETNNPLSDQADGWLTPHSNMESNSSGASNRTADTNKSKSTANDSNAASPKGNDAASEQDQYSKFDGSNQNPAVVQPKDNEKKQSKVPSSEAPTPAGRTGVKGISPTDGAKSFASPEAVPSAAPAAAPAAKEPTAGEASEAPNIAKSVEADKAAPAAEKATPAPDTNKKAANSKIMSITSLMPEETLTSKDGKYIAAIEQHHISVKDNATLEIIFTSDRVWSDSDKVTLLEWTEDGKLTYQVSNDQGIQKFQIDAVNKSEVLQK
jgi:hypothetical protein